MSALPFVHVVHAHDAPQHLSTLNGILDKLLNEKRIEGFSSHDGRALELVNEICHQDMILVLLTEGIVVDKPLVEKYLLQLRDKWSDLMIVQILVDNIPYHNSFTVFPEELIPICEYDDMNAAWGRIGLQLQEIFPQRKSDKMKYMLITFGAVLLVSIGIIIGNIHWQPDPVKIPPTQPYLVVNNANHKISYHVEDEMLILTITGSESFYPLFRFDRNLNGVVDPYEDVAYGILTGGSDGLVICAQGIISNTTYEACGSFISAAELKFSGTTRYTFSIPVNEVTSSGFASVSVGVYRPFAGSWINYPEVNNNNMFEKAIKLTVR